MSLDPVAVGVPEVRVANSAFNGARTIELMEKAEGDKAILALFPELGSLPIRVTTTHGHEAAESPQIGVQFVVSNKQKDHSNIESIPEQRAGFTFAVNREHQRVLVSEGLITTDI